MTMTDLNVDCKPLIGLQPMFNIEKIKATKLQKVPHLPRKEQQATSDFITDSVMQLATMAVQLWFC